MFVKLYGEKGDTNKMTLAVSDNDLRNYFETGRTDIFTIETSDIGKVGQGPGVLLRLPSSSHPRTSFLFADQPSSDWTQQRGVAGRVVLGQRPDPGARPRDAIHVPEPPLALQRRG